MNSERTGSLRMKVGMKTARMQSMANKRAVAVAAAARRAARATESVCSSWACVFSIVTTASSTRIPMASANPPSDMMFSVCPASHRPTRAKVKEQGMLTSTTATLRTSPRNKRIISPVSPAPIRPSVATLLMAARTVGDSSNSYRTLTSSGTTERNKGIDWWIWLTTVSVDAVSFFTTGI